MFFRVSCAALPVFLFAAFMSQAVKAEEGPTLALIKKNDPSLSFNAPVQAPDPKTVPLFSKLIEQGGKVYYMGERSGLQGWFTVKDGRAQMFYVSPDGKSLLLGSLFTNRGEDVTGMQVVNLLETNKEFGEMMKDAVKQQHEITNAGSVEGKTLSVPSSLPLTNVTPKAAQVAAAKPLPAAALSPGDQLMQDLKNAAGAVVGNQPSAEILMVMDPSCANCRQTWKDLRLAVLSNKLQIKLVPVDNLTPADVEASANLLASSDPLSVWDKYVAGDKSVLAGQPSAEKMQAVQLNRVLLDKWKIEVTPYLVYRSKNGKVKIVVGRPADASALVNDVAS